MIGHAAHGRPFFLPAVLSRKGNLQFPGSRQGIFKKHFVEISQSVKKNTVGIFLFGFQVFLHHGCKFSHFCILLFVKNADVPYMHTRSYYTTKYSYCKSCARFMASFICAQKLSAPTSS